MDNIIINIVYAVSAVICSFLLAFALTPPVRVFAFLIGAVDVPTDDRRMHTKPTPRIGGLAIFGGFAISSLVFGTYTPALGAVLVGGLMMIVLGVLDDVFRLKAWMKLIVQIGSAGVAVLFGVLIDHITLFGERIDFGILSYPITILWIVGLTNAINLLDGLDGLACGVSAIMSITLLGVVLIHGDYQSALIMAILAASCLGFLPFNTNPARIFMGDTGSLFLGYVMAVMSIQGVFKMHTVISFIIPLAMFALPLMDTLFAIFRRLRGGESPFSPDRKHLHHKLVDMGFTQREAVRILYAVCGILGLVSITFSEDIFSEYKLVKTIIVAVCALVVFGLNYIVMKKTSSRVLSGLTEHGYNPIKKGEDLEEKNGANQTAKVSDVGLDGSENK